MAEPDKPLPSSSLQSVKDKLCDCDEQNSDGQADRLQSVNEGPTLSKSNEKPTRRHTSGYECEFIHSPPESMQTDCPVCLLVLREPHQVVCCGYNFCKVCIGQVQCEGRPCPTCNKTDFVAFVDKRLQRSLFSFKVFCSHRDSGCKWTGELGGLGVHLNEQPLDPSKRFHGCQYVEVDCLYCANPFQRRIIEDHQLNQCPQRPYSCDYCDGYEGTSFDDVVKKHHPVCKRYPLSCPNECDHTIERQNLEYHVKKECPLTVVECDFHYAGCGVKLPRKDMPGHLAGSLVAHMSLLAVHGEKELTQRKEMEQQLVESKRMIDKLQTENKTLKQALEEKTRGLIEIQYSHSTVLPIAFTMTNFKQHKKQAEPWFSPPFYTHPHGYRLCVKILPEEHEVFIGTCVMRGKFDSFLQWPFQGDVKLQVLNQLADAEHLFVCCSFSVGPTVEDAGRRIVGRERRERGFGENIPYFSCQTTSRSLTPDPAVLCQYLRDNCLQIKVLDVEDPSSLIRLQKQFLTIESRVCVPPFTFTMNNFEQHKKTHDHFYSPAWYSHPQGYRMCLRVDCSSYGGYFVSAFVHLMHGEFDSQLKWPFRGTITIQLLNQLADKNHASVSIAFTDETSENCSQQAVVGDRAEGWGKLFITHMELNYSLAKNCQYLKDDCLIFRITKVERA